MPRTRAFYSVLQYVPDGGRAEGANTGVVLFVPETGAIEVQTTPTLARVKQFFAPDKQQCRRIELAVKAAESRLKGARGEFKTEEEFARFIAARADAVRLTPPRLVVVSEVETKLGELYRELVGDAPAEPTTRARRGRPLPARVAEVFKRLTAEGKAWAPGRVLIPETNHRIKVPLAYQNGRVNFVVPQSLAPAANPESRLPKLGFDGLLIYQHKIDDRDSKLVVLSADANADRATEERYAGVLDDFHVRFVPYAKAEEFAEEVAKMAH